MSASSTCATAAAASASAGSSTRWPRTARSTPLTFDSGSTAASSSASVWARACVRDPGRGLPTTVTICSGLTSPSFASGPPRGSGLLVPLPSLCLVQRRVAAAPEQQRGAPRRARLDVRDPADDDLVVAPGDPVLHRALQRGQDIVQPRAAGPAAPVPHAVPRRGQPAAGGGGRQGVLGGGPGGCRERA